jgi:Phospholipid methyltransferase
MIEYWELNEDVVGRAAAGLAARLRTRSESMVERRGRIMSARGRARLGAQDKGAPAGGRREQWLSEVSALTVGVAFFSLWFWLLPGWLGFRVELAGTGRWRWLAAIPSVLGFAVALRCVWDFGWTGRGTPAPVAPPKRLVIVGFYRYVRNPMYLGFAVGWIGLWVVFGHANPVRSPR